MPSNLQEWLALAIVVAVAALALWRWLSKRRAKACGDCAVTGCGVQHQGPEDEDVRVLARPELKFTKRPGSE